MDGRSGHRVAGVNPNIGSYELPASSHNFACNSVVLIPTARAIYLVTTQRTTRRDTRPRKAM